MSWHLSQGIQVSSLTHFSHPGVQSKRYAPHQFSRVFSRGLTLTLHIVTTPIYVFLCGCSLSDSSEHLSGSILFHTLLCNGRGRKCIEKPQAKGLKVNINIFPCLSLLCFEVITRSVCTFSTYRAGLILARYDSWCKRRMAGNRRGTSVQSASGCVGQQNVEGGQQVLRGDPSTLSTHTKVEFLLLFYYYY